MKTKCEWLKVCEILYYYYSLSNVGADTSGLLSVKKLQKIDRHLRSKSISASARILCEAQLDRHPSVGLLSNRQHEPRSYRFSRKQSANKHLL
jgi:hypothetical protein